MSRSSPVNNSKAKNRDLRRMVVSINKLRLSGNVFLADEQPWPMPRTKLVPWLMLLILGLCPVRLTALSDLTDCQNGQTRAGRVVCSDPQLRKFDDELGNLVADRSAKLGLEASRTLARHEQSFLAFDSCLQFRLTTLDDPRVSIARRCMAEEYKARLNFIKDLPLDTESQVPYLLPGFQLAMLRDGPADSDLGDSFVRKTLVRVFSEAIKPDYFKRDNIRSDALDYFVEAALYNWGTKNLSDHDRYFFGWTFQRHAGFNHFFVVIDLHSGEVVLASSEPGKLDLLLNACVSETFERYADHRVHGWLVNSVNEHGKDAGTESKPPNEALVDSTSLIVAKELRAGTCN
jgi:hypothetical protein